MQALPVASPATPVNPVSSAPANASAAEGVPAAGVTPESTQENPAAFDQVLAAQIDAEALKPQLLLEAANADLAEDPELETDPLAVAAQDASLGAQLLSAVTPAATPQTPKSDDEGDVAGLQISQTKAGADGTDALHKADQGRGMEDLLALESAGKSTPRARTGPEVEQGQGAVEQVSQPQASHGAQESQRAHTAVRALEGGNNFSPRAIPEPVRSPQWGEALGQRVVWMAKENVQVVYLQVEPPNLGPLEVQLRLNNDQANLMFVSAHSGVREAISGSLAKLDEMLAAGGVSLGSVSVNTQSSSQDPGQRPGEGQAGTQAPTWSVDARTGEAVRPARPLVIGLVDTFA